MKKVIIALSRHTKVDPNPPAAGAVFRDSRPATRAVLRDSEPVQFANILGFAGSQYIRGRNIYRELGRRNRSFSPKKSYQRHKYSFVFVTLTVVHIYMASQDEATGVVV